MDAVRISYLVILTICVFASGFFSGSETALIGIGRERVRQLASKDRRGEAVGRLVEDPDRLLSTLLVANNLVNILAASVATALFIDLVGEQWGPWLATGIVTAVILVVGEITPKTLATRYPERFSLAVAPTIWRLSRVLAPVSDFFAGVTRGVFRLLRIGHSRDEPGVTEEDIRTLAVMGEEEGEIEAVEREIIDALFEVADRPVREVMTPRVDIQSLALPLDVETIRASVAASGHSRFPVVEDDLDNLVGVLYVKDLLRSSPDPSPADIRRMLRTPFYVPESTAVLTLLQQMRSRRIGFGVVLDEHGGIDGIFTVKDLVSELVGEIQDEYDPGAPAVVQLAKDQWLADGRLPVEDLEEHTGRDLPAGQYSTVGGLFMALAGRIPDEGDSVSVDGITLTVLRMDRNRVDRLRVDAMLGGTASSAR